MDLIARSEKASVWVDSADLTTHLVYSVQDGGTSRKFNLLVRQFVDNSGDTRIDSDITGTDGAHSGITTRRLDLFAGSRHGVFFPDVKRPVIQLSRSQADLQRWHEIDRCDVHDAGFLAGRLAGGSFIDASIFDLLRRGNPQLNGLDQLDGVACSVVEEHSANSTIRIWIAPSLGYNFLKFEVSDTASIDGSPSSFTASFDNARTAEQQGRIYLAAGHYHDTVGSEGGDGSGLTEDAEAERTEVNISPSPQNNPQLFTFDEVPNGAEVRFDGGSTSGVRYIWSDGQAIPYVDKAAIISIRQNIEQLRADELGTTATRPGVSSENRPANQSVGFIESEIMPPWMLGAGVAAGALLLVIAGVLVWPRSKNA
jgi:hypothetical protein